MNLTIKTFLFITLFNIGMAQAKLIKISITKESNINHAKHIRSLLNEKFNIPKSLIAIRIDETCKMAGFQLCINKKGELKKISLQRIENFKKTFSIFNLESKNEL